MHHEDHEEELDLPPSKTKIKKQMLDLQDIGEQLVTLSKDQLKEIDIPETLRDAILEAKRITKFGAVKRQMQYIGKLMRGIDAAPIRDRLAAWHSRAVSHTALLHRVERWRERLLGEPDAFAEFASAYPHADLQRLRTLIRNAQHERFAARPQRSYRELFRQLREMIGTGATTEVES